MVDVDRFSANPKINEYFLDNPFYNLALTELPHAEVEKLLPIAVVDFLKCGI